MPNTARSTGSAGHAFGADDPGKERHADVLQRVLGFTIEMLALVVIK